MTQKVLVTGGAGFIGSHLVDKLVSTGFEVVVLDDFSSGFEENLHHALATQRVELVRGDVRDFDVISRAAKGCRYVFHLACFIPNSVGHVIRSSAVSPELDADITIRGALNVLRCAKMSNAKVLFASSAAVYGDPRSLPVKEGDLIRPVSPYGVSKAAAELYCKVYGELYGLKTVLARIFNAYGPRQRKCLMYDVLVRLKMNPERLIVYGSGKQIRDFIYVEDVANILIRLMEDCEGTFNVGSGKAVRAKDVVRMMCDEIGVDPDITYTRKSWAGDIDALVTDVSKLRKSIRYVPKMSLPDGVKELISWFNKESGSI